MTRAAAWSAYVHAYHDEHPGITERLLQQCTGDPYGWLLDAMPNPTGWVLDLASGSSPLFGHLRSSSYLGVDYSWAELTMAAGKNVHPLIRADAARLPIADSSIDAVVCSMALQVLTPLAVVLSELARVLRPGGRLVALLPGTGPLTVADRLRYTRLLWELRRCRLGYANGHLGAALTSSGWRLHSQVTRRFGYPIRSPADARGLVESFYLPGTKPRRQEAAKELVAGWAGVELGVPLRRLVAISPHERGTR